MAQAKTWAAFDVHVSGVVAATLDRDNGLRYPADPPKGEEIIAVMRAAGDGHTASGCAVSS